MTSQADAPRAVLVPAILAMVVVGTLVSAAMTPKDMSQGESAVEVTSTANHPAFGVSRLVTAGVLAVAAVATSLTLVSRGLPRGSLWVWLSYLAFTFTNFILPGLAGHVRGLDARLLYTSVVFSAAYFARPLGKPGLALACKVSLGAFLYAAVAGAILAPTKVVAADYEGLVPALSTRLYGLGGGATSLGAQAAGYLALELAVPSRSWTRFLHGGVAALVLVWTQSKTSWGFVLGGALIYALWTRLERPASRAAEEGRSDRGRLILAGVGAVLAAVVVVAVALAVAFSTGSPGADNLKTLTGRSYIWVTSLDVWLAHPVLGYGVGLWLDEGFRATYGAFAHAHNQFLHALASGGLVGLAGLLAFLFTAWRVSWRAAPSNPVALVLLALLLVQCFTDVPMRHLQVLDAWTVVHLLTFLAVCQAAGGEAAEPRGLTQSTFR